MMYMYRVCPAGMHPGWNLYKHGAGTGLLLAGYQFICKQAGRVGFVVK
jgi:hypothetical protein